MTSSEPPDTTPRSQGGPTSAPDDTIPTSSGPQHVIELMVYLVARKLRLTLILVARAWRTIIVHYQLLLFDHRTFVDSLELSPDISY